ncbi:Hpt domain-containing protein [Pseudohaliea rubra]|uniref:Hpt domain-containing protein n=1 Tax=Pseudohaliea rubra TaxID=475795 RepID=UPI000550F57F|nr:Hpt domain-containing protein [Pseudohaliea rubra]
MTSEPGRPPLDYAQLLHQCAGDAGLVTAVLESYRADSEALLRAINEALAADDRDALSLHAHSLKGMAAYLRAGKLEELAQWLEAGADSAPQSAIAATTRQLEAAHQALLHYLDQY